MGFWLADGKEEEEKIMPSLMATLALAHTLRSDQNVKKPARAELYQAQVKLGLAEIEWGLLPLNWKVDVVFTLQNNWLHQAISNNFDLNM